MAGGPRCCTRAPTVLTRAGAHEHRAQLGLAEVRRRMVSCVVALLVTTGLWAFSLQALHFAANAVRTCRTVCVQEPLRVCVAVC